MLTVSLLEAKERLPELIEKARAGEDVVIANDRKEAVRLVPVPAAASEGEHPVGSAARILAGMREPKPPGWVQKTPDEIDAIIRDIRESAD